MRGLSVLEHGQQVFNKYSDLLSCNTSGWRLPSWYEENKDKLNSLMPTSDCMALYHIYHDVGKPFCRAVDAEGKQHFPNHARISAAVWHEAGGDSYVGRLIEHDMDMHLMKPHEAATYKHLDIVPPLLITALTEIHANAEMFGGIESISFKIKFKALSRLGNAFMPLLDAIEDSQKISASLKYLYMGDPVQS